jgi:hypothetical protein
LTLARILPEIIPSPRTIPAYREDLWPSGQNRAELSETPSREKEEEKSLEQLLAELRVVQRNDIDWDRLDARRADRQRRD